MEHTNEPGEKGRSKQEELREQEPSDVVVPEMPQQPPRAWSEEIRSRGGAKAKQESPRSFPVYRLLAVLALLNVLTAFVIELTRDAQPVTITQGPTSSIDPLIGERIDRLIEIIETPQRSHAEIEQSLASYFSTSVDLYGSGGFVHSRMKRRAVPNR